MIGYPILIKILRKCAKFNFAHFCVFEKKLGPRVRALDHFLWTHLIKILWPQKKLLKLIFSGGVIG